MTQIKEKYKIIFEEVYREKTFFGYKYHTNFKFINNKGEVEFGVLRIDKRTYLKKLFNL